METTSERRSASSSDVAAPLSDELRRRIEITASCRDSDPVPKVETAGRIVETDGVVYQVMHNGLRVVADGYCGRWMTELIGRLRGHHEPQEERVFDELLRHVRPGSTMIELGSGWAYYGMWFLQRTPAARLVLVEPDPTQYALGLRNLEANAMTATTLRAAVDERSGPAEPFPCEDGSSTATARICVDDLVEREPIDRIELLLADIQGAELAMLRGAERTIRAGRLRFVLIATHHHTISGDPLTHQRCRDWIVEHGGRLLAAFNVTEGYSGDGFLAASFDPDDRGLEPIAVSRNHPTNSLFRELEYDLAAARRRLRRYDRWFGWLPYFRRP